MSDDLVRRLREQASSDHVRGCQGRQYSCDCGYDIRGEGLLEQAATALTEARAEIERRDAQVDEALRSCLAEREGRLKAESELSTLRARVREVVGPLVHACEADYVGDVCKDEDPNESVALGEDGPSALTFGMIYAARQLNEEVK